MHTSAGDYRTRYVVDAAGVHADDVAALAGIHEYRVQGRHGNICVLDKELSTPISTVMFPCPSPETKGLALIDLMKGSATKNGQSLELTAAEQRLLIMFLQNPGMILSRNSILERLWDSPSDFVDDNTLSVYIRRLRSKIEDDRSLFCD